MARKPLETVNNPVPVAETPQETVQAVHDITAIESAYGEERDLANQLLGQIQMSRAISKFTDVVSLQKLRHIKENKIYRALRGKKAIDRNGDEIADVGTFEGFCRALGTSASKVDEDLANLAAFGEEALAQLTQVGAGYREMRQFRRLPEDQKTALIEVAKLGDKESFIELAEEIITKHSKEKESLTKRVADIEEDAAAKDRLIASKNERLDTLETELGKKRAAPPQPDEQLVALHEDLSRQALQSVAHLDAGIRSVFTRLADHHAAYGGDSSAIMAGVLDQIERITRILREDFRLSDMEDVQDFLASLQATPGAAPLVEGL